ncbi:MAG: hypothetical protein ACYDCO_14885 [Armatimonadota bacterium]
MDIKQLLLDRNVGLLLILLESDGSRNMKYILSSLGFNSKYANDLIKNISPDKAIKILEYVFGHELAYDREVMPPDKAHQYAFQFVNEYYKEDGIIYTNGHWDQYNRSSFDFVPLTFSTIDAGIIIVHKEYLACAWVMDED